LFQGKKKSFEIFIRGFHFLNRHCVQLARWIPKGEWSYDNQTRQVRSTILDRCVTTDGKLLFLETCDNNSTAQQWTWKETYLV
jgi:hypothetical protein